MILLRSWLFWLKIIFVFAFSYFKKTGSSHTIHSNNLAFVKWRLREIIIFINYKWMFRFKGEMMHSFYMYVRNEHMVWIRSGARFIISYCRWLVLCVFCHFPRETIYIWRALSFSLQTINLQLSTAFMHNFLYHLVHASFHIFTKRHRVV